MLWLWITLGAIAYLGVGATIIIFSFTSEAVETEFSALLFVFFLWPLIVVFGIVLGPVWCIQQGLKKAVRFRERADKRRKAKKKEEASLTERLEERVM